ncbi:hypothetical protein Ancab_014853, partial [Ancistrocladus abbreviatus]
ENSIKDDSVLLLFGDEYSSTSSAVPEAVGNRFTSNPLDSPSDELGSKLTVSGKIEQQ